jgi:SAM-dependent methyltransferase
LAPGWRCWDVGAGGGSIARRLSEEVGAAGRVLATDLETQFLETLNLENLEVRRHDITGDPLPDGLFDIVHARMILIHLPEWPDVVGRLAAAVAPGGWLVCEEFDAISLSADPAGCPGEVVLEVHQAMSRLAEHRGLDRRCGRLLCGRLRALGFVDVGADAHLSMVQPRSPMTRLLRASYELRRREMIAQGYISSEAFERDLQRLDSDGFMMPSPIMWTAYGRRPEKTPCASDR